MKKINMLCLFAFVLLVSCGLKGLEKESSNNHDFYVLSVSPESGAEVGSLERVTVSFSQPVFVDSVTEKTLFVIKKSIYEEYDDWDDLSDDLEDGDVQPVSSSHSLSDGNQTVSMTLTESLTESDEYVVVALPFIQSIKYYSLDQTAAGLHSKEFSSSFVVSHEAGNENESESVYPETPENEEEVLETFDWNHLLITEVVTDPQQDHGESEEGNGIVFDDEPGLGTIGSSDEYIEIFNGTEEVVNISSYQFQMLDGTDELQLLGEGDELFFSMGGDLENFQSGEFLVFGNPTGALNNEIKIELLDESGELVDSVDIEDANATGIEDEAFYRDADGEWESGVATPGDFPDL